MAAGRQQLERRNPGEFKPGQVGHYLRATGWFCEHEAVRDDRGRKVGDRYFWSRGHRVRLGTDEAWTVYWAERGVDYDATGADLSIYRVELASGAGHADSARPAPRLSRD